MKTRVICTLTCFAFAALAARTGAQSLADVARKEQERRKAVKSAGKVYTNDDLEQVPAPLPVSETASEKAEKPAPSAAAKKSAAPAAAPGESKDEKYWRDRITIARTQMERNQVFLEALQSRVNALTNDFAARDDPAQRALISEDRQKALAEMERVRQEIEKLKSDIAAIEEEARRANVPPGWLR